MALSKQYLTGKSSLYSNLRTSCYKEEEEEEKKDSN